MKKNKMVAIDLDGTLLKDNKTISFTNMRALLDAMKAGVRICISTGRAWPGAKAFARQTGCNAPVITSNGAMLVNADTEEILYECTLKPEIARAVYDLGNELGMSQIVWAKNILYGNRLDGKLYDYGNRFGKMEPRKVTDFDELNRNGILKILWYDEPERISEVRENLCKRPNGTIPKQDEVTICTSNAEFLEFFSSKVSKAEGLNRIISMYGIEPGEVIALGDGSNDIEMLRWAGLGVAMGNATDNVKAEADVVTDTNEADGVAKILREYIIGNSLY